MLPTNVFGVQEPQEKQIAEIEKPQQKNKKESIQVFHPTENPEEHWSEEFHDIVADSVHQSAVWFDSFFIDDERSQEAPKSSARIRFSWAPKARDWEELKARFRLKVKLPHLKDKVSLVFSDEIDSSQDKLPLEGGQASSSNDNESLGAAIRYVHKKEENRLLDAHLGISSGDIFARIRSKQYFTVKEKHGFKVIPSVFYFIDEGLGSKLLLEYEYQLDPQSQFRINYSIRGSESFNGIRWKHGFYKLKQHDVNTASVFGLHVEGERNGEEGFLIEKYTLSYRYRFNALKDWLFFEVQPFFEWPEDENYTTTPGIFLGVEGYFSKN